MGRRKVARCDVERNGEAKEKEYRVGAREQIGVGGARDASLLGDALSAIRSGAVRRRATGRRR